MALSIKTQFDSTLSSSVISGWRTRKCHQLTILMAVHQTGPTRDILIAHTNEEAREAARWIMAQAAASGDQRLVIHASDCIQAVRRAVRERRRPTKQTS